MKQILFLILFSFIAVSAQTKPVKSTKPDTKTQLPKSQEITTEKAVTENGKVVILSSNGTWEIAATLITEKIETKPCDLTLKDLLSIRGLRLGISKDEVRRSLESQGSKINPFSYKGGDIQANGVVHYIFYESILEELAGFSGIRVLELDFFNDAIHSITVKYSESTAIFTTEQLRLKISEYFKLPVEGWSDSSFYIGDGVTFPTGKKLECREFDVEVISGDTLKLTNLLTSRKIEESEKNKRNVFKP